MMMKEITQRTIERFVANKSDMASNKVFDALRVLGCDLSIEKFEKQTYEKAYPLHQAIMKSDSLKVTIYLMAGYKPTDKDNSGLMAIDLGLKFKNNVIMNSLIQYLDSRIEKDYYNSCLKS